MMQKLVFYSSLILVIASCNGTQQEHRVYTEKDIDGYWATNNSIQGTQWLDTLSIAEGSIDNFFLRFYNDACGLADTVYRVSGDTIFMLEYDYVKRKASFPAKYVIRFVSDERLILAELPDMTEITYYSLMTMPASDHQCTAISLHNPHGGLGVRVDRDSLTYFSSENIMGGDYCPEYFPSTPMKTDSAWFNRINSLYCRLSPEDILFAKSEPPKKVRIDDDYMSLQPSSSTIELSGTRGREMVGCGAYISNPVLRAIYWELAAPQSYEYKRYNTFKQSGRDSLYTLY